MNIWLPAIMWEFSKFTPITYDPVHHGYYRLGERVGNAFKDGAKLK